MNQQSSIIYTVVVRNQNTILSEYASASGNYVSFVKTVISKVQGQNHRKSFQYDKYGFHILTDGQFAFLIMTDADFKLRIAFACLEDLMKSFNEQFTQAQRDNSIAFALQNDFSKVQRFKVEYYNSPQADKISQVKAGIEETKNLMMENLDTLLLRGEKLEILVQKTEHLVVYYVSTDMKKHATQIRRDMWWKNKKMMLILILVVILLIYFIMVISCGGFKMSRCF